MNKQLQRDGESVEIDRKVLERSLKFMSDCYALSGRRMKVNFNTKQFSKDLDALRQALNSKEGDCE